MSMGGSGVPNKCTLGMQEFLKDTTRFSSFFLIYATEVINPVELVIPTPKVVLEEI